MIDKTVIHLLAYLEPILCAILVYLMVRAKAWREFKFLVALLCVKVVCSAICLPILYLSSHGVVSRVTYPIYFTAYWAGYALEAILSLCVIYSIFKLAMAPLKGLQTLGMLVFRWVAAISVAVAIGVAFAPHISGIKFAVAIVTQLQQTSSILTLCLLLFVCFAIRPMGLSYRSRIFGVSLGMGVLATANLVGTAWLAHYTTMYSTMTIVIALVDGATLLAWTAYFAFPEPKRRMIILPTTSPFLRWNQISMALGDEPGYVAIGGISPDVFAPAELEFMRRASAKMPVALEPPTPMRSLSA